MYAPAPLLAVWNPFATLPCETFTKGWWYGRSQGDARQRGVPEMIEHRARFGGAGNCFDLALWLMHLFEEAGIDARPLACHWGTSDAHVAVLATVATGEEFLCDPGDCWITPVLAESNDEWRRGFFPGREIRTRRLEDVFEVDCRRGDGEVCIERYPLAHRSNAEFAEACRHSQNLLRRPFCECLLRHQGTGELSLWEYDRGRSYYNLFEQRDYEPTRSGAAAWQLHITERSGLGAVLIREGFAAHGE